MKNIQSFKAGKYDSPAYREIEAGIYEYDGEFVTSLSFEQEPEYEEEASADCISQYPLEDILDRFSVYVSDFYDDLNVAGSARCYLEFSAATIDSIRELRAIIGKHVYNKPVTEDGVEYADLVIE